MVATDTRNSEIHSLDPFDLLCHLTFNAPVLARRQRASTLSRSCE